MKDFLKLYDAGRVKRYHTADVPEQNLAYHSWGVAMIVAFIYPNQRPPANLLMAALTHDLAESFTGDVPATAKWANSKLDLLLKHLEGEWEEGQGINFDITLQERKILQWADTFELMLYCNHLAVTGNHYAVTILNRGIEYTDKIGFPTTEARELYDSVFGQRP